MSTPDTSPATARMSGPLLQGRGVIVTGAASPRGLGLAAAKLLAEHGARVLITDLDAAAAERAAASLPGSGHAGARCDVTGTAQPAMVRPPGPRRLRLPQLGQGQGRAARPVRRPARHRHLQHLQRADALQQRTSARWPSR
jgi:hypothetical protein